MACLRGHNWWVVTQEPEPRLHPGATCFPSEPAPSALSRGSRRWGAVDALRRRSLWESHEGRGGFQRRTRGWNGLSWGREHQGQTLPLLLQGPHFCPCPFQDSLHKRSLRRPLALSSVAQSQEEEEGRRAPELPTRPLACPVPQEGLAPSACPASRSPLGQLSEPPAEKHRPIAGTPPQPSPGLLQGSGRWRGLSKDNPAADGCPEADGTPLKFSLLGGSARATQERLERAFKRQGNQCLPLR